MIKLQNITLISILLIFIINLQPISANPLDDCYYNGFIRCTTEYGTCTNNYNSCSHGYCYYCSITVNNQFYCGTKKECDEIFGLVFGIIGGVLAVSLIAVLVGVCIYKKKRKQRFEQQRRLYQQNQQNQSNHYQQTIPLGQVNNQNQQFFQQNQSTNQQYYPPQQQNVQPVQGQPINPLPQNNNTQEAINNSNQQLIQ
ncbi:hypothetical protein PPERSA_04537 [Pseudocohnilembus persalinus]|uniref:Transmembrane protein n=1 Tax=Pseudocohnilembus persalinus TaxID=266149 RepID=A0A0V0QT64_PSEPJ|nr:hypothetical protein PPERSA_04537 [Pseudocohnilembus persalinus]|eukprot:KRX05500.1 hypothetical protein PPERSA_04537 [Pseudocohnilembus persalinus]